MLRMLIGWYYSIIYSYSIFLWVVGMYFIAERVDLAGFLLCALSGIINGLTTAFVGEIGG